jgi:hypothetical protein
MFGTDFPTIVPQRMKLWETEDGTKKLIVELEMH